MRTRIGSALAVIAALLASCSNTTGGALITVPFVVGGVQRDASQPFTFTNPKGWTITLNTAQIALGPFYFNVAPPDTTSCVTTSSGTIIVNVTSQVVVNALDPTLYEAPSAVGETGTAVAVHMGLLPPDDTAPGPLSDQLNGGVAYVAGTATNGTTTVPFSGAVVIDQTLASPAEPLPCLQQVRGALVDLSFASTPQTLEMRVDPTHWFDQADFSSQGLPSPMNWQAGSSFNQGLLQGIGSETGVYDFSLVPGSVSAPMLNSSDGGTDGGAPDGGTSCVNAPGTFSPGFTATSPNTPGSIEVTISGETLAENGLPFTPVNMGDPQFVDGWNMKFDKYIVVVGNVRLSPNALQYNPSALSDQVNPPVATKAGPYVVDLHRLAANAPGDFVGADGQEPAGGLFVWNADDRGNPFDTNTLYAFSYDVVPATCGATNVNLSQDELPIYDEMVQHGWNEYLEGTATYVGYGAPAANGPAQGTSPYPDPAIQAEFSKLPTTVHFVVGWTNGASYINCINPFNGDMSGDNPLNRGMRPSTNSSTIAQITVHTDHVFWDKLKFEGTPLRFDYIAAWAPQDTSTTPFDLGLLANVPIATTFSDCTPLPDRAPYQNVPGGYTSDQADPKQVVLNLNGVPAGNIMSIADFMGFSAQSQDHFNANGLCYVKGQNASDPFFVPNVQPATGTPIVPHCSSADGGMATDGGTDGGM